MLRGLDQGRHQPGSLGAGGLIGASGRLQMRLHTRRGRGVFAGNLVEYPFISFTPAIEHRIDHRVFAAEAILHATF
ncbi:hypothetical protein D3C77_765640 [compost metagenome]